MCPDTISKPGTALRGYRVADRESDVVEARAGDGLPVTLGPELGEGGEHDVVDAEVVSHEDGHDLEGWLRGEKAHGSCQRNLEYLPQSLR